VRAARSGSAWARAIAVGGAWLAAHCPSRRCLAHRRLCSSKRLLLLTHAGKLWCAEANQGQHGRSDITDTGSVMLLCCAVLCCAAAYLPTSADWLPGNDLCPHAYVMRTDMVPAARCAHSAGAPRAPLGTVCPRPALRQAAPQHCAARSRPARLRHACASSTSRTGRRGDSARRRRVSCRTWRHASAPPPACSTSPAWWSTSRSKGGRWRQAGKQRRRVCQQPLSQRWLPSCSASSGWPPGRRQQPRGRPGWPRSGQQRQLWRRPRCAGGRGHAGCTAAAGRTAAAACSRRQRPAARR